MTRTSLSVWTFDGAVGASEAVVALREVAAKRPALQPDAAVVWWDPGAPRPNGRRVERNLDSREISTRFWHLLFVLVFSVPLLGAATGTARGAIPGALAEVGLSDTCVNQLGDEVTPGTSALLVLSTSEVVDAVSDALAGQWADALVTASLRDEQGAALRTVFAAD